MPSCSGQADSASDAVTLGEREFRVGDRVLCRHNDTRLGLQNGMRGTIVKLEQDALLVRTRPAPSGSSRSTTPPSTSTTATRSPATQPKARPSTAPSSSSTTRRPARVGLRRLHRARTETRLYLADHDTLEPRNTRCADPSQGAPPERAARALNARSAEPLALDQMTPRPDIESRLHARRHDEVQRQRERASERLDATRRQLNQLGWWSRGEQRFKLECAIALQELALRGLDQKLGELARTPQARARQMPGLDRDHEDPSRSRRPEPPGQWRALQREAPSLGLER